MAGVVFTHPNNSVGTLRLRLAPSSINWTYNMNTSVVDTYGGQVIQLLSINFDKLTITGRFGREGPHGKIVNPAGTRVRERQVSGYRDYRVPNISRYRYAVGLSQMTEYFSRYFAVASQGKDAYATGHYDQRAMTLRYAGALDDMERSWTVYPVDFPSYSRAIDEFAPEWTITFEIEEPDYAIKETQMKEALKRIRSSIGYTPANPFSDPLGSFLDKNPKKRTKQAIQIATEEAHLLADQVVDHYRTMVPALTDEDLDELIFFDASIPNIYKELIEERDKTSSNLEQHLKFRRQKNVLEE